MKKKLILTFVGLILIAGLASWGILSFGYSEGVRSGKLVKLSRKGMLIKTYEGTLDLGSGDKLTWDFSIHKKSLGDALQQYSGKYVRLTYKEHLLRLFYGSRYNVVDFELVDTDREQTQLLCRFVNVIRRDKEMVEGIRPLIQEFDPGLLPFIRKCQK